MKLELLRGAIGKLLINDACVLFICRSIKYTVNDHHSSHLPVKARVTELSLKLSTNTVKLTEPPLARQSTGTD